MSRVHNIKGAKLYQDMGLFGADLPEGFRYQDDFITLEEETALSAHIASVEFSAFEMRGVVARQRVAFFGSAYDSRNTPTADLPAGPDVLLPGVGD